MDPYLINDKRTPQDFHIISFSGYKKSEVKSELIKSISHSKIENACNWSIELLCSGHLIELWEIIFIIMSKKIHLANPLLPTYICLRFKTFKTIIKEYINNELEIRNNPSIRSLFIEIISILCFSQKKPSIEFIKVPSDDFEIINLASKLKAPDVSFVTPFFKLHDPKEIFMALNEFIYQIKNKNFYMTCYWIEWIIEFDSICRKKKKIIFCQKRDYEVEDKYKTDIIWICWDILIKFSRENNIVHKIMNSLNNIFTCRYSVGTKKKRKGILYFAIELLTEKYDLSIPIVTESNKQKVDEIIKKNKLIFKSIISKNKETIGEAEEQNKIITNLDKTNQKLEMLYN